MEIENNNKCTFINFIYSKMYSNYQPSEPDLSSAMGLLAHLNIEELKEILNDDTKFENMIKDVKQVQKCIQFCP